MKIKDALSWSYKELNGANVSEPIASANLLMADVLGIKRNELLAKSDDLVSESELKKFKNYISQRKNHKSVWHIVGMIKFWGLDFYINNSVLVPRPETEILVESVVNYVLARDYQVKKILDVGTGSGAIAIALAAEFPEIILTAVDKSREAIKIAQKNTKFNMIKNIKFIESDLFSSISGKFDIICANLPYIPSEEIDLLPVEVRYHEPHLALDGGNNGLEIYERFLSEVGNHLKPGGAIFCEIGVNQGKEIKKMTRKYFHGFRCIIKRDLAGIDRVAIIFNS